MISVDNLTVSFGGWDLFREVSFLINAKDRIGLVGKNGAGKSTMLKVLIGEQPPSSGTVSRNGDCTVGYLPQQMKVADTTTLVLAETESAFSEVIGLEREIEQLNRRSPSGRTTKARVRKAAAPVERCDRPLSHSRRMNREEGGRKDAARTGLPTKRLRTGDQRVQRRMADAHRTGEAAASPAVGIPARRTHESPRHREHRMARKLPEGSTTARSC